MMNPFGKKFVESCKNNSSSPDALKKILNDAFLEKNELHSAFDYICKNKNLAEVTLKDLTIYYDEEITIARAMIPPQFKSPPHNHAVWAVIGIYDGEEENTFFKHDTSFGLKEMDKVSVQSNEIIFLEKDVIHAIKNPTDSITYGIHIYGGDLINNWKERSTWDPDTFEEKKCTPIGVTLKK